MEITLGQLAVQLGGLLVGGNADCIVTGVAGVDTVADSEVTYIADERYLADAEASPALAILAPNAIARSTKPLIRVDNPRGAFAKVLQFFDWRRLPMPGIDPSAHIAETAAIHGRAHIGAFVTVGAGTVIGDGCIIFPHTVIGDHAEIGPGSILYAQVTVYPRCHIGARCIVHAGAVIGADGLGFNPGPNGWEKIPHLGTVLIEDDVEIGANTTIDRGTTGETVIGHGTKIDNLVQIAHNVKIGPHCMIASQVGIAGSTTIEEWVIFGGQAGITDHGHVGAGARIAARAGVVQDIPAGVTASGFPARAHREELRREAAQHRMPDLLKQVKELERRLRALEDRQG
ncbi:MAG: UDP-3-O-(3-hydroxymyristoyl)glucosamine N-acyltransferase [Armatimonadota bacterium]